MSTTQHAFAVGMIYSKLEKGMRTNVVLSVVVDGEKDDNKHDVMARAQKCVDSNRAEEVDGFKLDAFDITYFEMS